MKRTKAFGLSLVLLASAACGGSGSADKGQADDKTGVGRIVAEKTEANKSSQAPAKDMAAGGLHVKEVRLSTDNLYANSDLTAEVEVAPPVPDGISFEYRWYVANQLLADADGPTLKAGAFRKHQWILCEARALAGDKASDWRRSNFVRAADSPPRLEAAAVESFNVPGRFSYRITASDIDNDELSYELVSPLDLGIELDKRTGLLTWEIDAALAQKLDQTVEIQFAVSDSDAKPSTGSITLRFQKNTTTQPR